MAQCSAVLVKIFLGREWGPKLHQRTAWEAFQFICCVWCYSSSSSSHVSAGTPALCCDCLSVPSPLMKAVDNCTQNPKTANTMGLFPLFSPSPQDLCTLCHLAQHGLPWITGRLLQSQLQVEPLQSYRNKSGFVPCRLRTSLPWTCAELDSQGSSQSEIKHNSLQCCFVCRDWAQALCVTKSW